MVKGNTKKGPGYEGVDPAAECNINKTAKFAVWDAPGVSQPPPPPPKKVGAPAAGAGGKENATPGNMKQKQNNNRKFVAATAAAATTGEGDASGGGGGKKSPFPPTATLQCDCGSVVISVAGPPLNRVQSCDYDSRFALNWCEKNLGGPKALEEFFVDMTFFTNTIQVEQGGENLDVFMIKEGYNTQRVVATCCGTLMMGDHPLYNGKKFAAYVPPSKITYKNCDEMPAQKRIFEDDFSSAEQAKMWLKAPFEKPTKPAVVVEPTPADLIKWKAKHPRYTNLQRLIGSIGPLQYMDHKYEGKETEYNRLVRTAVSAGNL